MKPAIEQAVPAGGRVFSFAGRAGAYLDREIVVGYESTEGMEIQETLEHAAAAHSGQRAAALAAKAAGLGFWLVNDSDAVSDDLRKNSKIWGVSEVAKAHETTLYRVD